VLNDACIAFQTPFKPESPRFMREVGTHPRVSIIVPFLNPGGFLQDAIDSVLSQTYESWELLLVDDGSTDQSTRVAKMISGNSGGRIRYLEHPGHANRGMPASRNMGIINSRGVYIANLDADDTWDETFLAEFVSLLDGNPSVAMTFGPMKVWSSWSDAEDSQDWIQSFSFLPNKIIHPPAFLPLMLTGRNDPQGCVFRRTILDEVGLYEESLEMCEDWALFVKIALKYEILPIGTCHYRYRQHPGQFCRQRHFAGSFHREFLPFLHWLRDYLKTTSCNDREVLAAVSKFAWRNRYLRVREFFIHAMRSALLRFKIVRAT
jgi:glycosyltransferase involved in cell wall biosynthesis